MGIGTSDTERVAAAAVVRLDPTADVMLLSDYDFIHALWQKASDAGERLDSVRTAAEKALASTVAADHVSFIVTGVHDALKLDQKRERDKAEAARAARQARQSVLTVIGIPSTPELLALSDDNFIRALIRHQSSGIEVRAAATRALQGDEAAWREFIVNGARAAHKKDVDRELAELEENNRKEAELRRNQAARKNVAALFRVPMTAGLLEVSDDNFLREMLRQAPADLKDSELYRAAQKAVLSTKAADWLDFLYTGADAAYKRDDDARRKKLAEANRMLAQQILATAKERGFNPNLVASAEKALAAGDVQVAEFLSEEGQKRARRQTLLFGVRDPQDPLKGFPLRHTGVSGGTISAGPVTSDSSQDMRENATWLVVPSLAGQAGCFSFEAASKPGHYIKGTVNRGAVVLGANDNTAAFRNSATWCFDDFTKGIWYGHPDSAVFTWSVADKFKVRLDQRNELVTGPPASTGGSLGFVGYQGWAVTDPLAP
ncbi:AbfB domain-containing protein [Streptomyces sp. NBC_00091]|uniref:AbfB domain-containing protein n=1 Tax=Streptomyces sp. NBC_00091 TaxID=2975648 RepID=UPI0022501BF2|nr:AbfB domain-containing protein [Streptomyces sp. NBC_00091]MCX5377972.1 AbfB domain-containing protein [Streptomyces sp. NBC_00091]